MRDKSIITSVEDPLPPVPLRASHQRLPRCVAGGAHDDGLGEAGGGGGERGHGLLRPGGAVAQSLGALRGA